MDYRVIDLRTVETAGEGYLTFFEGEHDLPFPIRRIYYIHGTAQGVQRGGHAHRALRQMLFCPYGSILIKLDDGREVLLDRPEKGQSWETACGGKCCGIRRIPFCAWRPASITMNGITFEITMTFLHM